MNSFDTNDTINYNKNLGQYDKNAILAQIMTCHGYPASLMNQNEIHIELTCQRAHLAQIMSLMSMKMLANVAHMRYHLR